MDDRSKARLAGAGSAPPFCFALYDAAESGDLDAVKDAVGNAAVINWNNPKKVNGALCQIN